MFKLQLIFLKDHMNGMGIINIIRSNANNFSNSCMKTRIRCLNTEKNERMKRID